MWLNGWHLCKRGLRVACYPKVMLNLTFLYFLPSVTGRIFSTLHLYLLLLCFVFSQSKPCCQLFGPSCLALRELITTCATFIFIMLSAWSVFYNWISDQSALFNECQFITLPCFQGLFLNWLNNLAGEQAWSGNKVHLSWIAIANSLFFNFLFRRSVYVEFLSFSEPICREWRGSEQIC